MYLADSSGLQLDNKDFFVPTTDLSGWDSVRLMVTQPDVICGSDFDCPLATGTISPAMIPEPSTALLLGMGLAGLAANAGAPTRSASTEKPRGGARYRSDAWLAGEFHANRGRVALILRARRCAKPKRLVEVERRLILRRDIERKRRRVASPRGLEQVTRDRPAPRCSGAAIKRAT